MGDTSHDSGHDTGESAGIRCRRVYEDADGADGTRVLVDRVWPRGLRKADARLDAWLRDVAPSTELRRWYGHEPARYPEFRRRYLAELREPGRREALAELSRLADGGPLTLLTATRDVAHSQAAVLADRLAHGSRGPGPGGPA
ncbi:DUF488 domain-containing protein [Streptomyces hoynatensis]|uniref:DUF488 family protein n=1 Tax=Streptomyces hoynatensis TaxID=1141874 RepID=A0A3A9YW37_9ACTN|nr:DUF488 family protein [Streptomyces hoynatensis]RKN40120.1 DUF488 family protein [Streptomyces hoynatensis]